jgi:hypothetical protein
MDPFTLDIVNQAITSMFVGIALSLINVIICYFAPFVPRIITVLGWNRWRTALIAAYLIALVIQVVTSPYLRSLTTPAAVEVAWSPYQALFNVVGVALIDGIMMAWAGARRGAQVGGQKLAELKDQAADRLGDLGEQIGDVVTPADREAHQARQRTAADAAAATSAERQKRLDDKLKDY